ncbi:MAG: hypothetical protein KDA84_16615, partial [Planctomycetaceae bacterium]|nr:hypothetical protein [Planctomycetaceae bacterium]
RQINFGLVRIGSWGLVGSLGWLWLMGFFHDAPPKGLADFFSTHRINILCRVGMLGVSFFGGLFIVPLQVFLQARPPKDQKGRMIGAMNLVNWLAICFAGGFMGISNAIFEALGCGASWNFGIMALVLVPVAIFYHPPDENLSPVQKT